MKCWGFVFSRSVTRRMRIKSDACIPEGSASAGKVTHKLTALISERFLREDERRARVLLVTQALSMVLRRMRRGSAFRRQTSVRQPSLRQSKAPAEAPHTIARETTIITISGDKVTVQTAA